MTKRRFLVASLGTSLWLLASPAGAAVKSMALGGFFSCALLETGAVKCFGKNDSGQLGQGDKMSRGGNTGDMGTLPAINLGAPAQMIAAGGRHACALLDGGAVKCWGNNAKGQLGLGDVDARGDDQGEMAALTAVNLGTGRKAARIAVGDLHSCALLDDKTVKCWGRNDLGQLGQPDTDPRGTSPDQMGDALLPVAIGRPVVDVVAGGNHTCFLLDDASVKCLGDNGLGQLGDGGVVGAKVDLGTGRTATAITAGFVQTCAVLDDGGVKCWGYNGDGRLGLGDLTNRGATAETMGDALAALDLAPGQRVQNLQCGYRHCCAAFDTNTTKCFGVTLRGALGLGDNINRGAIPSDMGDELPFIYLGRLETVRRVFAGDGHTCVLLAMGRVKCFGDNRFGQLGLGDARDRGASIGTMGPLLPDVGL